MADDPWAQFADAPAQAAPTQDDPWSQFADAEAAPGLPAPSRDAPMTLSDIGRQAALAGRATIEGAGSLLALPSDALFGTINYGLQKAGITKEPYFKLASQSISEGLTKVGVPTPQTRGERFASAIEGGLAGGGGTLGVARGIASSAAPVVGRVGASMLANPGLQTSASVGSSVAANEAREQDAPLGLQLAAGVLGGVAGGGGGGVAGGVRRGLGATIVEPLTETGRRAVAGRLLNTSASNAERAATNLGNAQEIVRGSMPTTGQAARDAGLAYFENRLRALDASKFSGRTSQQNEARQLLLDSIARSGESDAVQNMVTRRDNVTAPMRNNAFIEAQGKPVDNQKILQEIDGLLAYPDNAGESVQRALRAVRTQVEGKTDARELYAVRKEINRLLDGKYVGADEHVLRYAGSQLKGVRDSIDEQISAVAPSWQQYLTKYAQLSRPIERAETVSGIRGKVNLAAPDIETGREFLSQAKFKQVVARNLPELSRTLTKGQITKLRMIAADLDRGAAAVSGSSVRSPGSDTAANLAASNQISVANIVSRALNTPTKQLPPALATLSRPLSFVYKLPDESIKELLVDAMLDPKLADQLMKEGSIANVQAFAESLAQRAQASGIGTASSMTPTKKHR